MRVCFNLLFLLSVLWLVLKFWQVPTRNRNLTSFFVISSLLRSRMSFLLRQECFWAFLLSGIFLLFLLGMSIWFPTCTAEHEPDGNDSNLQLPWKGVGQAWSRDSIQLPLLTSGALSPKTAVLIKKTEAESSSCTKTWFEFALYFSDRCENQF